MYKIIEVKNYRGLIIYQLIKDNVIINSSISEKNLKRFNDKGISFTDSEGIKKFLNIYNL